MGLTRATAQVVDVFPALQGSAFLSTLRWK